MVLDGAPSGWKEMHCEVEPMCEQLARERAERELLGAGSHQKTSCSSAHPEDSARHRPGCSGWKKKKEPQFREFIFGLTFEADLIGNFIPN